MMKNRFNWRIAIVLGITLTACQKGGGEGGEIADSQPDPKVNATGFYVANEGWMGYSGGTVNYFKYPLATENHEISYRIYQQANPNEELGSSTQFATIWGKYAYFCSKQGSRLVVTDAKTMKKRALFEQIGGDGRSFVGVDNTKGYLGHSEGMVVFDITNLQLGAPIGEVSGQIGSMCLAEGRVFAISQENGLYVIDTKTDRVERVINGNYNTLTRSKDGNVWIASSSKLIKLNPTSLETEEMDYPGGANVGSSWGAWNAGSLCASTQKNVLYWTKGTNVVKYDIDTKAASTQFYTLGESEYQTQLAFYGAGLRVDPLTDELILTVKHIGWEDSGAYNWVYKLSAEGQKITHFAVKGDNGSAASWAGNVPDWDGKYFWFPAIPFFEDANKPQILINQILLKSGEEKTIDLNKKIVDYDNSVASIQKSIEFANNRLVEATLKGSVLTIKAGDVPGRSTCTITAISNGVRIDKIVRIDVE